MIKRKRSKEKEKIPCNECICIAVCKSKSFDKFISDCSKVRQFIYDEKNCEKFETDEVERHKKNVKTLCDFLQPNRWELGLETGNGYYLVYYNEYGEKV
jgi:hypothetical protein